MWASGGTKDMMGNLIEESREVCRVFLLDCLEGTCTALDFKLALVATPGGGDAVSGDEDGSRIGNASPSGKARRGKQERSRLKPSLDRACLEKAQCSKLEKHIHFVVDLAHSCQTNPAKRRLDYKIEASALCSALSPVPQTPAREIPRLRGKLPQIPHCTDDGDDLNDER
jgi:hypothetical protein